MTPSEIRDRWLARREEWSRLHVQVDGAALADEVLADFDFITMEHGDAALSLTEAARESGYSVGHLGREIRAGRIQNAGREKAPKIRRRDLPRKPGALPESSSGPTLDRKRIARAVANSSTTGVSDG